MVPNDLFCLKACINSLFLECINFQVLRDADRKITAGREPVACDNSLGPAWFRFLGDAGTKMPTSAVPETRCGTDAPGWLNGAHPTVSDGVVIGQVCFHYYGNICHWSINIQVRNCGEYFVYYYNGTPPEHPCTLRYCGID